MALTNNQKLGTWLSYAITVRVIGDKKFAVQSTADGGFVPRGRNIMKNADAQKETDITDAMLDELEPSDDYGTAVPQTFSTPTGYTRVMRGTTPVYYPDALIEQNPSLIGDGSGNGTTGNPRSANTTFEKAWEWIKANPLQASIIAFVVYVFVLEPLLFKKKGKKSLISKIF